MVRLSRPDLANQRMHAMTEPVHVVARRLAEQKVIVPDGTVIALCDQIDQLLEAGDVLDLDTVVFACPACATSITARRELLPFEPGIYECSGCRWAGEPV
jgi:predicted RNA-binding Zn-ribbon protein involved in translation (DUF1610 family)